MDMVSKNVMKQCFLKLLGNVDDTDEEDIESAIKLLTTIGESYDKESRDNVSGIMNRLQAIQKKDGVSSRVKFMIEVSLFSCDKVQLLICRIYTICEKHTGRESSRPRRS
jgi:translation initiation factor 4G